MFRNLKRFVIFATLGAVFTFQSINAAEIDTAELEKRCESLTAQQRQLAATAGFDIDNLCSKLENTKTSSENENIDRRAERPDPNDDKDRKPLMLDRDSVLNDDDQAFLGVLDMAENKSGKKDKKDAEEGEIELERYGYNLFSGTPTTFAPVTELPVPVNYVIGVGDTLLIQLMDKTSSDYELKVDRDGSIHFPDLGPINIAGLEYSEAKKLIKRKVSSHMIGAEAHITLGELRSIRVFVLGEAYTPGSYTVSALSTMTNAIFVSGGITEIASLRNIQLKRRGKLVSRLDLYDLLQKGDTSTDANLQPGDVIYIPTASKTVTVTGEVNRPAIYEIKKGETLSDLVKIAGGFSSNAYPDTSFVERNNSKGFRTVIDINLSSKSALKAPVFSGDSLTVGSVLDHVEGVVKLTGHFHREKQLKWKEGLRTSDVIKSISDFKDSPELGVALIIRKKMPLRKVSILHFNIERMLATPLGENDLLLEPLDEIMVFGSAPETASRDDEDAEIDLNDEEQLKDFFSQSYIAELKSKREEVLEPIIELIKQQATNGELANLVDINGYVKFPGTYPMSTGMSIKDLVLLAGGLEEASYLGNVEITRRDMSDPEKSSIEHIRVNLGDQLKENKAFILASKDKVSVYASPEFREDLSIEIEGQVRFPGVYEFKQGETLTQVIKRAGGFTSVAHIQAAVFTREDLRLQEEKQIEELNNRLRSDIVASELEEKAAGNATSVGQAEALLKSLGETEALGRLVIKLEKIMSGEFQDIQLKASDRLVIPTFRQEVSVLGEVQYPTSHVFNKEWTLDDYVENSGGSTTRADEDRVYVVRADGSVYLPNQGGWLTHQNDTLMPGDVIVVPLNVDRVKSLTLWTQVSQVIYQLALGLVTVQRL